MIVELTRFRVKPGMSHKVDEWLKFLNDNMEGVLLTRKIVSTYIFSRSKVKKCMLKLFFEKN